MANEYEDDEPVQVVEFTKGDGGRITVALDAICATEEIMHEGDLSTGPEPWCRIIVGVVPIAIRHPYEQALRMQGILPPDDKPKPSLTVLNTPTPQPRRQR